jgi:acyl dehydratase
VADDRGSEGRVSPSGEVLWFEDLAPGQIYRTASAPLEAEAMKAFAAQWDPQPFHLDEAAGAAHPLFRGLVASGWHTACLSMRLIVTGPFRIAGGQVGAGVDALRWPIPSRPGDVLRVETEVLECRVSRSRPEIGLVKVRHTTINQRDEVAQVCTPTLVVPRRASHAPRAAAV